MEKEYKERETSLKKALENITNKLNNLETVSSTAPNNHSKSKPTNAHPSSNVPPTTANATPSSPLFSQATGAGPSSLPPKPSSYWKKKKSMYLAK